MCCDSSGRNTDTPVSASEYFTAKRSIESLSGNLDHRRFADVFVVLTDRVHESSLISEKRKRRVSPSLLLIVICCSDCLHASVRHKITYELLKVLLLAFLFFPSSYAKLCCDLHNPASV